MRSAKQLLLVALIVLSGFYTIAQNVGIGTTTPSTKLEVLTGDADWGIIHTNGSVRVGTFTGSNGGWIATQSTNPLYFSTSFGNVNSSAQMTLQTNGNLGIGTISPNNKLQIGIAPGFTANDLAIGNGTQAMSLFQSAAASIWYSNIGFALMPFGGNGYVGIGTTTPSTKLEVLTGDASWGIIHSNGSVNVGTYAGSGGGWIATKSTSPLYFATSLGNVNNVAQMILTTNGDLGVGADNPVNKLQVGNMGSTGFAGNDIAIGDNGQAMAFTQSATASTWYSTTNINFSVPAENIGDLSAGVNINSDVSDDAALTVGSPNSYQGSSINAYGPVFGESFISTSDARIKNIVGISDAGRDLETLNTIQITNYTMNDKIRYGDKPFKKIIAQQVEKVYPQVVNKRIGDIPNVYQFASKIEKTDNGYLLSFKNAHHLGKDAKKIQLTDKNGVKHYDIISIPSDKEVLISAPGLKGDSVFVYGEQVNDLRSVDYDGLTTLNISATQELTRLVQQQADAIEELKKKVEALEEEMKNKK